MRWGFYLGIAAVFLLGGVAGALVGVTSERARLRALDPGNPRPAVEAIVRRLERELKLNPMQSRQVREIYGETRPELQEIDRERKRRIRLLLDEVQPKVLAILNEAQQERYRQLHDRLKHRLRLKEPGYPQKEAPAEPAGKHVPPQERN